MMRSGCMCVESFGEYNNLSVKKNWEHPTTLRFLHVEKQTN